MDALDKLIFATVQSPLQSGDRITSRFIKTPFDYFIPGLISTDSFNPVFGFSVADKETFTSYADNSIFDDAIRRHWYDINGNGIPGSFADKFQYKWPGLGILSDFSQSSTYHLIYAYLIENTRILQIFEQLIEKYLNDEVFGIAPASVYQWMLNSKKLFFNDESTGSGLVKPISESIRRNAYYRMFGIDLAFDGPFYKAKTANLDFIPLFEKYLSEIWKGKDLNNLVVIASQLREMLKARRGRRPGGGVNEYMSSNLSMEEFTSVIMTNWFTCIISEDTRLVKFLNCQSPTIGERLIKIGEIVGIPAHAKCQHLFEMAEAVSLILNLIETGAFLENETNLKSMLSALNPGALPSINSDYMDSFLLVINNWEKATGHKIKNPDSDLI